VTSTRITFGFVFSLIVASIASYSPLPAQSKVSKPKPCVIKISDTTNDYQRVLSGPPQTTTMRSGVVVLLPSKSVGKHSTENYEEAVIVLAGSGEMRITGGETLRLEANSVAYCPPHTEHDVVNTGSQPLRYIYVVAKQRH
jgi:mannose-6-phosphate isomerase-like protein (cupin superfamily)